MTRNREATDPIDLSRFDFEQAQEALLLASTASFVVRRLAFDPTVLFVAANHDVPSLVATLDRLLEEDGPDPRAQAAAVSLLASLHAKGARRTVVKYVDVGRSRHRWLGAVASALAS